MIKRGSSAALLLLMPVMMSATATAQPAALPTAPDEIEETVQDPADEARAEAQRIAPEDPVVFNGGISLEERASAPDEGTKLEFFLKGGPYVSDVHVVVEDSSGNELVNTVTDGPWLILDLPDGEYQVHASLGDDNAQGGKIQVDSRSEAFGYMFPTL
jgi:hypothetical protein